MSTDLIQHIENWGSPRILVIGDLMLDRYVWGNAERISQEAPVILLRADRREERLGGASSVATMLTALEANVSLAGVVGADQDALRIRQLLNELHVDHDAVLTDETRPTTVKERYVGRAQQKHPQQILRVDYETRAAISTSIEQRLLAVLTRQIALADMVLISDYDKGVCTPTLTQAVIAQAHHWGKRVLVDPIRCNGTENVHPYAKYRGCHAMTPNRLEASLATGLPVLQLDQAYSAGIKLMQMLDLEAAIITLDKDGMALVHRDGRREHFPTRPRQVYDITGAGDMVLSVLGVAMAAGAGYEVAIPLANVAGGLEVEKIGIAPISRSEMIADLLTSHAPASASRPKLWPIEQLEPLLENERVAGRKIVFTNGCFDLLHAGHVHYLHEAKQQGDLLIVGLNSDNSVRSLKGPDRPIHSQADRAAVLAGLAAVDFVVVFDEQTPLALIQRVKPDVLVKGSDYQKEQVVGADWVEARGGRVHLAALKPGLSTTAAVVKIRGQEDSPHPSLKVA